MRKKIAEINKTNLKQIYELLAKTYPDNNENELNNELQAFAANDLLKGMAVLLPHYIQEKFKATFEFYFQKTLKK